MAMSFNEWYEWYKKKPETKKTNTASTTQQVASKQDTSGWFQKSEGNFIQTVGGTTTDVAENVVKSGAGFWEKLIDGLSMLGAAMNNSTQMQAAESEMIYNTLAGNKTAASKTLKNHMNYQDQVESETMKFVAKDLINEEKVAKQIIDPVESTLGLDTEGRYSVLGDKADALVQSGTDVLARTALGSIPVVGQALSLVTTGATVLGAEAENAARQGAKFEQAFTSGMISAGAEMGSEYLFGGIKFGGKTLMDGIVGKIASKIPGKFFSTVAKFGINAVGEGAEELISGWGAAVGQKLTYASEKELKELYSSEERWDDFVSGVVLGGFFEGVNLASAKKNSIDYVTELSKNERAVLDKVYKDTVVEEQKQRNGKKLTSKEKTEIFDKVIENMGKGYVSTDAIDSVLGGEAYSNYQNALTQEAALKKEIKRLKNKKNKTDAEKQRLAEAREKLAAIDKNGLKTALDEQITNTIKKDSQKLYKLKGRESYLSESYRESARRGQVFEADLNQYQDDYSKKTIKNIMDSKIANNTNLTHEFADMLAKMSADQKTVFDFTDNEKLKNSIFGVEGKNVNGYVTKDGITINLNSPKALQTIVGHEISHVLEGSKLYDSLQSELKNYLGDAEYSKRLAAIKETYKDIYIGEDADTKFEQELTADLVGDLLFTDKNFVSRLYSGNRNLFQKIFDEVKYLCRVATAGSKQARQLEKIKHTFEEVYKEGTKAQKNTATEGGVRYSIEKFADGKQYVKADRQVFSGDSPEKWGKQVTNYINETIRNGKDVIVYAQDGDALTITENTAGKAAFRNDVKLQDGTSRPMTDEEYAVKLRAESHIDEISQVSRRGNKTVPDYKNHNFAKDGFNYRTAYFMDADGKYYRLTLSVGKNGVINTVYNVGKIKEEGKYSLSGSKPVTDKSVTMRSSSSTNNSVPQEAPTVNNNYMQEDRKNSLSSKNEDIAPVKGGIYGKDIALQKASNQDLAPVRADIPKTAKKASDGILAPTKDDIEAMEKAKNKIVAPTKEDLEPAINKDDFIKNKANDLLNEINNMKKGTKVSKELSYLLDTLDLSAKSKSDSYKGLKSALMSIRAYPNQDVSTTFEVEHVARELFNAAYDSAVKKDTTARYIRELQEQRKINKSKTSLEAIQTELANVRELRDNSIAHYEEKIAQKQMELDSKKNKNTKVANNLKRQIERLKRLLDSEDANYSKRISNLEVKERLAKEGKPTTRQEHYNNIISNMKTELSNRGLDMDEILENAKRMHNIVINDTTPQRVNDKTFGYEAGEALNDLMFNKVALNESKATAWLNEQIAIIRELSKTYGIKPRSKESAAAQMYAEGFYVNENNEIVAYGDAELAKDFPDSKVRENIKGLARDQRIRQIYDDTLSAINESRERNAYPEIPRLENYFLHFRAMDDVFSKIGIPFNPNDIKAKDLPTDLNGITADLKPGQPYFSSSKHRTGKRTSFDLLGGLEKYLNSASPQIFHMDDIQTERAMWNYIADSFGQAHGLENLDLMSETEQEEHIKKVYNGHLSNYARFLNEHANHLAGKTAMMDRALEGIIGRRGLQAISTINSQSSKNQVGFNVSSAGTNFIPAMEAIARAPKRDSIKAFGQMISNVFRKDGFVQNDPALIRRRGADKFSKTPWEKASDAGYIFMSAVDNITSEFIVRTKYNELTRKGMDSDQAHIKAGEWAMRIMGDRSLGQMPLIYNSKTLGILTKYQLEVRNLLDSQFYDTIQEAKMSTKEIESKLQRNAEMAGKATWKIAQISILNHIFGAAFEKIAGYNPAFDIISTIATLFGWDDDEDDEDTFGDNFDQAFQELLGDLPYANIITGGGRIPMADALPIGEFLTNQDDDGEPIADGEWGWLTGRAKTVGEALPYALPGGYGQLKKTTQGLSMFKTDDEHPVSGSYTDSGKLRFPVEKTPGNMIQATIFGQWASENARDYFDKGWTPLNEKQIQEYKDVDMPYEDYQEYRKGLKGLEKLSEKADYIADLDIPVDKKNILINNVADRKEPIDLTNYDKYPSFEEFDYSLKNPGKYAVSKAVGGYNSYKTYSEDLSNIKSDKDRSGNAISGSRKKKVVQYINSLDADYGEKLILYKSQYTGDDTYNYEIVEYLNSRDDLSYTEMKTILEELGFTVLSDGRVRW